MVRKRKFSVWRSVLKDPGSGESSAEDKGYVRKRVKSISKAFISPWAAQSNVDASRFAIVRPPRRPTLQNLAVFLRNSKVTPGLDAESFSDSDLIDTIIKVLLIVSGIGALFVIILLVLT